MKRITNWNGLEEYGIDALTGESCAYMYRLLCDVNHRGRKLLADCFGLPNGDLQKLWRDVEEGLNVWDSPDLTLCVADRHKLERGRAAVKTLRGLGSPMLAENWNGSHSADGSIMLPHEAFKPLAVFALIGDGYKYIHIVDGREFSGLGGVWGFSDTPADIEMREKYVALFDAEKVHERCVVNPGFARNVHQMSQRSV